MILHMANRVVMYNKSLYAYNLESPTSISSQGRTINAIEGSLHSAESVYEYFNQNRLETISDYTERKYYSSIIECYYECWMKRKESLYDQKMRELKKEAFNNKKMHMKLGLFFKYKIFYSSPTFYCLLQSAVRWIKANKI